MASIVGCVAKDIVGGVDVERASWTGLIVLREGSGNVRPAK